MRNLSLWPNLPSLEKFKGMKLFRFILLTSLTMLCSFNASFVILLRELSTSKASFKPKIINRLITSYVRVNIGILIL
jgi:hypothetical protein